MRHGITQRVIDTLAELGPMARVDLEAEMGEPRNSLSKILLNLNNPMSGKRKVYIESWTQQSFTPTRLHLRPVWAVGNLPNAKRPPRDSVATIKKRRYYAKLKRVSSVWDLGKTTRERMAA